jgi:SAM-dependent methyltransferase
MTDRMAESGSVQELNRRAAHRLNPRLTDPNYLVLRKRSDLFRRWLADVPGTRLLVLDVGGRLQPYRPLVEHRLARYLAVDLKVTALVDIVGRGEQLPLGSGVFDLVFCTQVLEYVPIPSCAAGEFYRVLKPGGVLLLSAPSIFPRDSDEEYWRFEPASLRMLLAAFSRIEVEPEGGSITGFFRTMNVFLVSCARFEWLKRVLAYSGVPFLNLVGRCLESLALTSNDQFAANYSVLAQK